VFVLRQDIPRLGGIVIAYQKRSSEIIVISLLALWYIFTTG
jgi:hypothetical protein